MTTLSLNVDQVQEAYEAKLIKHGSYEGLIVKEFLSQGLLSGEDLDLRAFFPEMSSDGFASTLIQIANYRKKGHLLGEMFRKFVKQFCPKDSTVDACDFIGAFVDAKEED